MCMHGTNNVTRAVQMDPTLLYYASVITEQKKCYELLAQKFWPVSNFAQQLPKTCKKMQQNVQTDRRCNIQ